MIMLETDVLASHSYLTVHRQLKPGQPERKLMFAVLVEAIQAYQKFAFSSSAHKQALFRDAEKWLWSNASDDVFSFSNICEVFEVNPAFLRCGLVKWRIARRQRELRAKTVQLRSPANRKSKLTFTAPRRRPTSVSEKTHGYI